MFVFFLFEIMITTLNLYRYKAPCPEAFVIRTVNNDFDLPIDANVKALLRSK